MSRVHVQVCVRTCSLYICSFTESLRLLARDSALVFLLCADASACACVEVTGNLKCKCMVSPQRDDFLCQQTVSWKIGPYYDEINFNGQGFQIFPTKSLKIRAFNDAFFCSCAVFPPLS